MQTVLNMNSSIDVMHQTIKKIILRFSEQTKEDRIYRKARELFFCQRFKDVLTLTLKQDGSVPCICLAMLGFQAIIWYYRHNSFPFLSRPKLCPLFLKREKLQVIQGLCCLQMSLVQSISQQRHCQLTGRISFYQNRPVGPSLFV